MMFRKLLCAAAAAHAMAGVAHAEGKIPIMLVGEWCLASADGAEANYTLPSWTGDGVCKKILSIDPWTISWDEKSCEPIQIQQKKSCAPSGCSYGATILARCSTNSAARTEARVRLEIHRYKGNIYIKER